MSWLNFGYILAGGTAKAVHLGTKPADPYKQYKLTEENWCN